MKYLGHLFCSEIPHDLVPTNFVLKFMKTGWEVILF